MRLFILLFLSLLLAFGCASATKEETEYLSLDQVPAPVMKTAREKLPDVTFETAWKTRSGNYEVRGKEKSGKVRDIQVKPNGEVVEID